ncbi:UbiA prenyltransferase family-domain-containing protein [Annulohypoxylon moriforme]|nr:UbiA prenyltransferase family-domain-containing protein [Annulohypoxylon moriforme]
MKMSLRASDKLEQNNQAQRSRSPVFHAKSLFLFTKSDFKTVFFPQCIFALSIAFAKSREAGHSTEQWPVDIIILRLLCMIFWIWIHLLVADISNQRLPESILEDTINKPWRPLPAGRLTPEEALYMLRITAIVSICASLLLKSYLPSTTLLTMLWIYNDLEGSSAGPWIRNGLNAIGITCYGWGAATVLLGNHIGETETALRNWYVLMAAVIMTTIHAQDFPDIVGDKARDRKTMPLLYGETFSRWSMAFFVTFWSIVSPRFWNVSSWVVYSCSVGLGNIIAVLVVLRWGQRYDESAFRLWCLWLTGLYLLPIFRGNLFYNWGIGW